MSQGQRITSQTSGTGGSAAASFVVGRPIGEGGSTMTSGGRCPNGHENSVTARFCRDCGQPIAQLPPVSAPTVGTGPSAEVTQVVPTAPIQPPTQAYPVAPGIYQPPPPQPGEQQRPAPRRGSWSMVLVTVLAVALVALGGVLAAVKLSGNSSSTSTVGTSATGNRSASLPATQVTPPPATPSTSTTAMVQAQAVGSLLQNSAQDRAAIVAAVSEITSCGDLSGAQETLDQAAASRRNLISQLGQLQTGALPNGAALVQDLEAAWQASLDSDNSYAAYAGDEMSNFGGCVPSDPNDANAQAAANSDSQATTAKTEFVNLWNSIAATYGLTQWQASNL